MKLELKHIVPYLPHELKFCALNDIWQITTINYIDPNYQVWANNYWDKKKLKYYPLINVKDSTVGRGFNVKNIKPLLRPLSSLAKEIEHKGEMFVPLVKLAEIEVGEHNWNEIDESIEDEGYAFYIEYLPSWFGLYFNKNKCTFTRWDDGEGNDACSNKLRDKLFEWHFDVFGLIDAGLAIEIKQ